MTPDILAVLRDLAAKRQMFYSEDKALMHLHRQLVMEGYASCRVEFSGEWISITDKGRETISAHAGKVGAR